jgi:hypothetical protein
MIYITTYFIQLDIPKKDKTSFGHLPVMFSTLHQFVLDEE